MPKNKRYIDNCTTTTTAAAAAAAVGYHTRHKFCSLYEQAAIAAILDTGAHVRRRAAACSMCSAADYSPPLQYLAELCFSLASIGVDRAQQPAAASSRGSHATTPPHPTLRAGHPPGCEMRQTVMRCAAGRCAKNTPRWRGRRLSID